MLKSCVRVISKTRGVVFEPTISNWNP